MIRSGLCPRLLLTCARAVLTELLTDSNNPVSREKAVGDMGVRAARHAF